MYPRTQYEMTQADLDAIMDACRPVPCILIGGLEPSQQENANYAWQALGARMGFEYMTVQPIAGKGPRFFTAVPSETAEARAEREDRAAAERKATEIARLEQSITADTAKLAELRGETA